jgi:hypothetical protein
MVVGWVFRLAVFCDEMKKKHKLEAVLNSIAMIGIVNELNGNENVQLNGNCSDNRIANCK